jgi:hypothetical protein
VQYKYNVTFKEAFTLAKFAAKMPVTVVRLSSSLGYKTIGRNDPTRKPRLLQYNGHFCGHFCRHLIGFLCIFVDIV